MPASYANIQRRLKAFDFKGLFTQELMWNNYPARDLSIPMDGTIYTLTPVAEQRGMAVYICVPPSGAPFPNYVTRRKIDTQVAKSSREHIVIFHDAAKTTQIWQWVKRESGKPSACREQIFYANQTGDALIQKIQGIAFGLEEVDSLSIVDVTSRVGTVFDVEKVTKRFYELFKKEHDTFQKFVRGIPDEKLQPWYVSVMLNRLMFIYFIQKKGFLDNDTNYLRHRLMESQKRGKNRFYTEFLCPLFFEGFAKKERSQETARLLGEVPYLNGGLFLKHQIEELHGATIDIPDSAFDKMFHFFEAYDWHLDERPARKGNEINPDVLGYVFEKYVNQKEMGAYYTQEDITEYISTTTIIPAIFDIAQKSCKAAFEDERSIWRVLKVDPDRYIHTPVMHGMDKTLPPEISMGISDVSKRGDWNKPAPPAYALATETWREVVARRFYCEELRRKLASGGIQSVNDLVSCNLDIRRFAEEAISNCEEPDLLRAFRNAIWNLSVLDPACGSGAFLFAALNILERLYDTCLARMQAFIDDLERSGTKHSPENFNDFRKLVGEMNDKARHPSPRYFILKTIILNNLYGVDIMEEATEICKLRLFLKLVAQVDAGETIEPLPDIDFNIRAGNTLVGFASEKELGRILGSTLDFDSTIKDIEERAEQAGLAYERFREMQVKYSVDAEDFRKSKSEVQNRFAALRDELDAYLSGDFGVRKTDAERFTQWRRNYHPFHWLVEFYGIMKSGGFDVIIGNPPYAELRSVSRYTLKRFSTLATKNLYSVMLERCTTLFADDARIGMIVPVSSISTEGYKPLQDIEFKYDGFFSSYDDRPSRLFDGLEHIRLSIHLLQNRLNTNPKHFSTEYLRWSAVERRFLFPTRIQYQKVSTDWLTACIPKISRPLEDSILRKVFADSCPLGTQQVRTGGIPVYFSRKVQNFLQVLDFVPKVYDGAGKLRPPSEFKEIDFPTEAEAALVFCVLNSALFLWFLNVFSDCRHVNKREVEGFRINLSKALSERKQKWLDLSRSLSSRLQDTSEFREMRFEHDRLRVQCILPKYAKDILDEIEHLLAEHFGLTDEELDFILNYNFKYRLGVSDLEEVRI